MKQIYLPCERLLPYYIQVEKSFYQMKGDVGMHNAKNHRNKSLHSKIIVQSCVTPEPELCREGLRMIVLLSCYEDLVPMIFRIVFI